MTAKPAQPVSRPELVEMANDIRLACMRISRRVRFESDQELPPHQFSVLARLEDAPRTNSELADIERVSAPSMKRTTSCLVDAGFVSRADDPLDRRQVILSLTPPGRRAVARVRRHRDEWMLERFATLTEDELALLHRASAVLAKVASK
ncbi:MarR family transcriptional regulator [Intrasporangium sp. DVR]|uniref:MarR family winged helix-turn-helix transcriptional regulator n=1 Tax=Intrasporangium sp. DVR TaxID=3127867 RepID=UPI00313A5059